MSLLNIGATSPTADGRRRMADVRSLGFSELFVLSKEDLWNALEEFPEAKQKMIEVGKERLRQDGLLAEQVLLYYFTCVVLVRLRLVLWLETSNLLGRSTVASAGSRMTNHP